MRAQSSANSASNMGLQSILFSAVKPILIVGQVLDSIPENLFGEYVEKNHSEDALLIYAIGAAESTDVWLFGSLLRSVCQGI